MILLRSHEKYAGGSILTEDYMVCVLPCHIYFKPERWPIQRARKSGRRKLGIQVSGWHWVLKPVAMRARADMRSEKRCSTSKSKLTNSGYACSMAGYGLLTGPGGYRAYRCRYILYWVPPSVSANVRPMTAIIICLRPGVTFKKNRMASAMFQDVVLTLNHKSHRMTGSMMR